MMEVIINRVPGHVTSVTRDIVTLTLSQDVITSGQGASTSDLC